MKNEKINIAKEKQKKPSEVTMKDHNANKVYENSIRSNVRIGNFILQS
jgi:hypothetical protein